MAPGLSLHQGIHSQQGLSCHLASHPQNTPGGHQHWGVLLFSSLTMALRLGWSALGFL